MDTKSVVTQVQKGDRYSKLAKICTCSSQTESLITLAKLKSYGITEDRLLQLNNMLLENNEYKAGSYTTTK